MVNWCFLALNHRLSFKEWKTAVRGRSSNWILLANAEGHATHPRLVGKTSGRQLAMVYLPLSQLVYLPSQLVPVIQDDGPSNWCVLGDRVMYVGSLQIKCHQKLADFNPNKKPLPVFWRFDIYPIFHDICFSTKQPTPSPWNVFFFFHGGGGEHLPVQGVGGVGCFGGEFQEISWSFHGLSCGSHLGTCLDFAGFVGFS